MARIPTQLADIDTAWLNEVAAEGIGEIADFRLERFGEGVGILGEIGRLHLTHADGADGPATIVAKCQSPAPENQFLARTMGFYLREVNFYREVAHTLDVRVPHAHHADCGPDGVPFVLLLDDVRGARCPDQITGITADEAGRILDVVADLHAAFWDSPRLAEMTWLPPMNNDLYKGGQAMALERWPAFVERFGPHLDGETLGWIERTCHAYVDLLDHVAAMDHLTFTHTDCRAENYLFGGDAGDDAVTMIDFQLSTRHFGPWDVANLVGGSMTPEVRRRHEAELVERYHDRVTSNGVSGYSLDRCWHDYRLSLLQSCAAQVIVSDLQGGNERGDELLMHLNLRPVLAAVDCDAGELLGELA